MWHCHSNGQLDNYCNWLRTLGQHLLRKFWCEISSHSTQVKLLRGWFILNRNLVNFSTPLIKCIGTTNPITVSDWFTSMFWRPQSRKKIIFKPYSPGGTAAWKCNVVREEVLDWIWEYQRVSASRASSSAAFSIVQHCRAHTEELVSLQAVF